MESSSVAAWIASIALFITLIIMTGLVVRNWFIHSPSRILQAVLLIGYIAMFAMSPPDSVTAAWTGSTYKITSALRQVLFSGLVLAVALDNQIKMQQRRRTDPPVKEQCDHL